MVRWLAMRVMHNCRLCLANIARLVCLLLRYNILWKQFRQEAFIMNDKNTNNLKANLFAWRVSQTQKLKHKFDVNKQFIERPRLRLA
jgi:hypothetical protein